MSLLIDCGNTRCKITRVLEDGSLSPVLAIALEADDFNERLAESARPAYTGEPCCLASVVNAQLTGNIASMMSAAGFSVYRVATQAEAMGMRIAYPDPQQLGVDRFLGLLAASQKQKSLLLVSAGSALTVDVLQANGQHRGGMICATESIMQEAMGRRFANFSKVWGWPKGFSDNTADALASGARQMVLGLIEKARRDAGVLLNEADLPILISGGDAEALLPHLPDNTEHHPSLVLEGLALWASHLEST